MPSRRQPAAELVAGLDFHPENLPRQPEDLYRSLVKAHDYYHLPYALAGGSEVLVVGCGAGNDVSAALLSGKRSIDAVDIDPAIIDIGRHLHPDAPYAAPGVRVLAQDARAYFQRCDKRYDLIVFGYLDSQSLFSTLSSVRLDAYVYTAESIRDARRLLNEGGHMVLYFAAARDWISQRLFATLEASFPGQVTAFRHVWEAGDKTTGRILLVAGDPATLLTPPLQRFERISFPASGTAPATDDWPFLYLHQRAIPVEYLYFMAFLVLLAVLSLLFSGSLSRFGKRSFYFFFLGAGFMIMETRAITQLTLFFGSTWITSLLIVSGILVVLWAANWIVMKSRPIPYPVLYGLILGSLLLQALAYGALKETGGTGVLLMLSVVYALPFFAAGLLFSQSFSAGTRPSADLGWNALGAFSGGFAEYLSMILGFNALAFIAMTFYAAAWVLLSDNKTGS